jgi:hypothetical protein
LLWKRRHLLSRDSGTDAGHDLGGRQQTGGVHDGRLAVAPARFDGGEPGTCDGQAAGPQPSPTCPFDPLLVRPPPGPHRAADRPGGIRPDPGPPPLLPPGQARPDPGQHGGGAVAPGPALDHPPPDRGGLGAQAPRAGHGVGGRSPLGAPRFAPPQRPVSGPTVQGRRREPTPPALLAPAHHPVGRLGGPAEQPGARRFVNASGGAGLVIQRVARLPRRPDRRRAWRMGSRRPWAGGRPRSPQTAAAARRVQVLRGVPPARGRSWSRARHGSARPASRTTRGRLGRREWAEHEASPRRCTAWMAVRTRRVAQPSCWAIGAGRCPRARARRSWPRRRVKAAAERRPAASCARLRGQGSTRQWWFQAT